MLSIQKTLSHRATLAIVLGCSGFIVCATSDWWFGTHEVLRAYRTPMDLGALGLDALISLPFWLVTVLLLMKVMSRAAALTAWVLLGVLMASAYYSAYEGTNSTAAVALVIAWVYGIIGVPIICAVDIGVRTFRTWLTLRRHPHHI